MLLLHAFVIAVMVVASLGAPAQAQSSKPAARKPASGPAKPAQQLFYDGFEAYKANRLTDAIRLYEQGLRQDPTNALAAFYLGEAYAKTGNPAKAQEWYSASLAANPQSEVAAQARERLGAAQRAAAPPTPPPTKEQLLSSNVTKIVQVGLIHKGLYKKNADGICDQDLADAISLTLSNYTA